MENQPDLLVDLVVALSIALVGGWLVSRAGLPAVIGFVLAGLVISPFTPGFVGDVDRLRLIADIGVVLLMFAVGVQFSLRELLRSGARTVVGATVQVAIIMALGTALGLAAGWGRDASLFVGAAAAISSSTVIVKLLEERGMHEGEVRHTAIAWSVVQDLWSVAIAAVLIALVDGGQPGIAVTLASLKAVAFVIGVLVVGLLVVPRLLELVAKHGSREFFVVSIAVLALGAALASEGFGLSLAFGAFVAGMVVSESDVSHRVLDELLPARDVFGVLFFVSVGMLIDPSVIADNAWTFAALVLIVVAVKGGLCGVLLWSMGRSRASAIHTAAMLAQAGEFSFVLLAIGSDHGAVGDDVFATSVAATAVSIAAGSVAAAFVATPSTPAGITGVKGAA